MVTKQQQLDWLAKECHTWNGSGFMLASEASLGYRIPVLTGWHIITREEWQMERDKMQKQPAQPAPDNSWHDRGELPPIGCECEWVDESGVDGPAGSLYPCVGDAVSVCAHRQTPGGNVIAIFTWAPGDDGLRVAASRMPEDFRPLRTEREKAIDEMVSVILDYDGYMITSATAQLVARQLHDSGYHR